MDLSSDNQPLKFQTTQVCVHSGQRETIAAAPSFVHWMVSLEGFCVCKLLLLLHNRWSHPHCLPSTTWGHAVPAQRQSTCCQPQIQARAMPGSLLTLGQYGCLQNSARVWCLAHVAYKYSYRLCVLFIAILGNRASVS